MKKPESGLTVPAQQPPGQRKIDQLKFPLRVPEQESALPSVPLPGPLPSLSKASYRTGGRLHNRTVTPSPLLPNPACALGGRPPADCMERSRPGNIGRAQGRHAARLRKVRKAGPKDATSARQRGERAAGLSGESQGRREPRAARAKGG